MSQLNRSNGFRHLYTTVQLDHVCMVLGRRVRELRICFMFLLRQASTRLKLGVWLQVCTHQMTEAVHSCVFHIMHASIDGSSAFL